MSRPTLGELFEQSAPVICASCYLGGEKFKADSVCPNTAKMVLEFAARSFQSTAEGASDDETVSLEVFGDTVDDRIIIESTVSKVREGFYDAVGVLGSEAAKCAATIGLHAIDGFDGLLPTETYTRVDISRLSSPKQTI
jgi:hypothetical protein